MKERRAELYIEDGYCISRYEGHRRALLMMKLAFHAGLYAAHVRLELTDDDLLFGDYGEMLHLAEYDADRAELHAMSRDCELYVGVCDLHEHEQRYQHSLEELDLEQLGLMQAAI